MIIFFISLFTARIGGVDKLKKTKAQSSFRCVCSLTFFGSVLLWHLSDDTVEERVFGEPILLQVYTDE